MELATPITIYWDLPAGTADVATQLRTCTDIVACRPLMLQLHDPAPAIRGEVLAVLERLKGGATAVSLTLPAIIPDVAVGAHLLGLGLKEILLSLDSVGALPTVSEMMRFLSGSDAAVRPATGISFPLTRENWRELPVLVTFCREHRISRLVLPMQRLYNGEAPFALDSREQGELADALAAAGGVAGVTPMIHDPFLWRAFNHGATFPQEGCQAANTMLAVAPDGSVYPCPTLPVRLGRIGEAPLQEIVSSSGKKELRRRLLQNPAGCRDCPVLAGCRGGCRGRAYVVCGSLEGADVACA
jgi:GeoRSP system SPASM domain protein